MSCNLSVKNALQCGHHFCQVSRQVCLGFVTRLGTPFLAHRIRVAVLRCSGTVAQHCTMASQVAQAELDQQNGEMGPITHQLPDSAGSAGQCEWPWSCQRSCSTWNRSSGCKTLGSVG